MLTSFPVSGTKCSKHKIAFYFLLYYITFNILGDTMKHKSKINFKQENYFFSLNKGKV